MLSPQTLDDQQADAQMMQTVDELAERTAEADALRADARAARAEADAARAEADTLRADAARASAPADAAPAPDADTAARLEQLLRVAAEYQNYRRRQESDRPKLRQDGVASAVRAFLPVLDDLHRALDAAAKTGADTSVLQSGVEGVARNFETALRTLGVEAVEAVGKPFDAHLHEALLSQPAPNGEPADTVLMELRKGYRMGDTILRHSQVAVAA